MYFKQAFRQLVLYISKIYYLLNCAMVAFDWSKELLNDTGLFNFEIDDLLEEYAVDLYGSKSQTDDDEEEEE